jgi:hypothetical protein
MRMGINPSLALTGSHQQPSSYAATLRVPVCAIESYEINSVNSEKRGVRICGCLEKPDPCT